MWAVDCGTRKLDEGRKHGRGTQPWWTAECNWCLCKSRGEARTLLELPLRGLCSWVRVERWRTLSALLVAIYQAWESHGSVLSCSTEWTSKSAQVCGRGAGRDAPVHQTMLTNRGQLNQTIKKSRFSMTWSGQMWKYTAPLCHFGIWRSQKSPGFYFCFPQDADALWAESIQVS